ncbi:MAG: hypothetical protein CDV28_10259 [Candidatus Electronema aureum]|uniref:Avidin family protein n=1 Tax=Candidatus Electronema aureum TaxID=2005002 RepID=A0A521G4I6_9BACT|nr:MAG: hypothetical protein CDV28_10259 [Candidatus Electronema aureum]
MSDNFKSAHDQATVSVGAALAPSSKPLVGTWINCDKQTGGIVKIEIAVDGKGLVVHAYGACHPDPCDWGAVSGHSYSSSVSSLDAVAFTAVFDAGFSERLLTGHLENGCLIAESYTNFKDGGGRYDYYVKECLCRCA